MGRPLHKRNFGKGSTLTGPQLKVIAVFDTITGPEQAYIVRQKGTRTFIVRDEATDTKEMIARMVTKTSGLDVGEMTLDVFTTSSTWKAYTVQSHRVKAVDTSDGSFNDKPWHYDAPTTERVKLDNN